MGLLRLLLAVSVFCNHSILLGGWNWMTGANAVHLFFVISGFYMQMVLQEKYTPERCGPHWIKKFYLARYLRLYPVYLAGVLALLAAGIGLWCWKGLWIEPFSTWRSLLALPWTVSNLSALLFLFFSNLTMFFQEMPVGFSVQDQGLHWSILSQGGSISVVNALCIPPGWTLGVELSFYLLAPFLLRCPTRLIIGLMGLLLGARVCADAWLPVNSLVDRLFPFLLIYFLCGAIIYRNQSLLLTFTRPLNRSQQRILAYGLVALVIFGPLRTPLFFILVLPLIFTGTQSIRFDRHLGDLSYPFYIFHLLVIGLVKQGLFRLAPGTEVSQPLGWFALLACLVFSYLLSRAEERWIEPLRSGSYGRV